MLKFLKKSAIAGVLSALTLAAASPAQARDGYRGGDGGDDAAIAIGAGVVGLALGAALASGSRDRYYDDDYYDDGGYYYRSYPRRHYNNYYTRSYPRHYRRGDDGWGRNWRQERRGGWDRRDGWNGNRGWNRNRGSWGHRDGRGNRGWRD